MQNKIRYNIDYRPQWWIDRQWLVSSQFDWNELLCDAPPNNVDHMQTLYEMDLYSKIQQTDKFHPSINLTCSCGKSAIYMIVQKTSNNAKSTLVASMGTNMAHYYPHSYD